MKNNSNKLNVRGQIEPLYIILKQWKWDTNGGFDLNKISVFVSRVSPQIQKELDGFTKKASPQYSNGQLDKYFGKGFVKTITDLMFLKKTGGVEISIDDILGNDTETKTSIEEQSEEPEEEPINLSQLTKSSNEKSDEPEISLLDVLSTIKPQTTKLEPVVVVNEPSAPKKYNGKTSLEFIYQAVWSIETPMDLREKIWTYMGIPMCFQHLLVKGPSGSDIPLYYNIYNNNKLVRLDIRNVVNVQEKYNSVPLIDHYYAFRDFFFIQTLDNFELLDKFISKDASSTLIIDCYDARDFLSKLQSGPGGLGALEKDKNMQHLIYYGFFILFWPMFTEEAFIEYIGLKGDIGQMAKIYPELFPKITDHKSANDKEYQLLNLFYTLVETGTSGDMKIMNELEKNLYVRISKNTILNFSYGENKQIVISLRNLFDKLVLTEQIVAIKYATLYANQRIELHKTYKSNKEITGSIPLNSLIVRCMITDSHKNGKDVHMSQSTFDVHFYENGNYLVKCIWGETSHYSFDEGIKIAATFVNNKIISPINQMKGTVIHQTYNLFPISPEVVNFSNINAEIYYRKNLAPKDLHLLRYVLRDFYEAKLFAADLSTHEDEYNLTYYLWKGNHQQDRNLLHKKYLNIANTYEYLTKSSTNMKWNQIYVHNKLFNITLRQTDIKFTLHGMWDKEFNIAYSYILLAMYMLHSNAVQKNQKYASELNKDMRSTSMSAERRIKSLKQIDPVLYDFKRYNSNLIYSKICQRPNQPQILTIEEYKALPEKEKERAIKYWNYTTQTETYYYAPNKKYPFINFIIGKHPMNYCIPCAKKTSYERKNNMKHQIYKACMETHKYDKGRKNIIVDTRYIMNYGKPIDAGRLCKLPENTLEPLFYESFYENAGFDDECYQSDKYFIYGVAQEWEGIQNMGIINTILSSMETTMNEFMTQIKKKILAKPSFFNIMLNGSILKDFYDYKDFLDIMSRIFVTKTLTDQDWIELNWTDIFIDILFYYFNLVVIEFNDKRSRADHERIVAESGKKKKNEIASNIEEVMPGDFIELQITNKLDVILSHIDITGEQYKYIIIVTKKKVVNPIYVVNPVVYFKSKLISKKIFSRADGAIAIMEKLLLHTKQKNKTSINKGKLNIYTYYSTLEAIDEFLKSSSGYTMSTYYVNSHNKCYYIGLKSKIGMVYLPVLITDWSPRNGVQVIYEPYVYRGKMSIKTLNIFLTQYNKWIVSINDADSDVGIRINKWISGPSGQVIGFMYGALNYYFNDISESIALGIKKAPIWNMKYDINDINKQLYNKTPIKTDALVMQISNSFYENHIYQILLLEFTTMLIKEKNTKIRTDIKKVIMGYGKDKLTDIFDNIMKILDKHYSESSSKESQDIWKELKIQDYNQIIETVNTSITTFMDKNEIYQIMDQSIYNFDKIAINQFKTMSHDQIKKTLLQMAKKITQPGTLPKVSEVPNILMSCAFGNAFYCKNKKLIVPEKRLNSLLDILAADIQNPMKEKWLFTPIFTDNIINFLKFEMRPLESITIELT
jgi:hypothetical protein